MMTRPAYYFTYKGMNVKYSSAQRPLDADMLTSRTGAQVSIEECYSMMTEFLSAFAFYNDAKIIPQPGGSVEADVSLKEYRGGFGARRLVPVEGQLDDLYFTSLVHTVQQAPLVSLYRDARSTVRINFAILYFWHCLVYPSRKENGI